MNSAPYPKPIAELLPTTEMPLDHGKPNDDARATLQDLTVASAFAGQSVRDTEMAKACLSGLWLAHNFLDESHTISQDIPSATGSFWHGIMHRREGDFGNSKYWFRRVGDHPVFDELCAEAKRIAESQQAPGDASYLKTQSSWDPYAFIDLCETAVRGQTDLAPLCRAIQKAEWELLFDYCFRGAR